MTSTTLRDIEDFPDVGEMMASKYLAAVDIDGAGELVTITSVKSGTETFEAGRKDKVNVIGIKRPSGAEAEVIFCKTNVAATRVLLGDSSRAWKGKRLVLVADQDKMKGEIVTCLRIRESPDAPPGRAKAYAQAWNHRDGRMNGNQGKSSLVSRLKVILGSMKTKEAPTREAATEQKQAVENLGAPLLGDEPGHGEGG